MIANVTAKDVCFSLCNKAKHIYLWEWQLRKTNSSLWIKDAQSSCWKPTISVNYVCNRVCWSRENEISLDRSIGVQSEKTAGRKHWTWCMLFILIWQLGALNKYSNTYTSQLNKLLYLNNCCANKKNYKIMNLLLGVALCRRGLDIANTK